MRACGEVRGVEVDVQDAGREGGFSGLRPHARSRSGLPSRNTRTLPPSGRWTATRCSEASPAFSMGNVKVSFAPFSACHCAIWS